MLVSLLSVGEGRGRERREEMQKKEKDRREGERGEEGREGEGKDCRLDFPERLLLSPRFWKA